MIDVDIMTRSSEALARPGSGRGVGTGQRLGRLLFVILAMSLGPAVSCRAAGLVIQAPDLTVAPGSSGSFDVLLVNTNAAGGASFGVSLDSLELALSGPAAVAFTNVTIDTVVPYIYPISATTLPGSNPFSFDVSVRSSLSLVFTQVNINYEFMSIFLLTFARRTSTLIHPVRKELRPI
jgi:hypothetical protein